MESNTLAGKIWTIKSRKPCGCVFTSVAISLPPTRATFAPGFVRFTIPSPMNSAMVVTISKYRIAFAPMRPTFFRSPPPAMPTTRVEKMSGAMIDLIRLRKMSRRK